MDVGAGAPAKGGDYCSNCRALPRPQYFRGLHAHAGPLKMQGLKCRAKSVRFLLIPFILLPLFELWLLIQVGSRIGALTTIGLCLLTAAIGVALLRQQGMSTLLRADRRMASGEVPAVEILEGFLLAVGGALLLTPGFFTDALGLLCLLPFTRRALVARLLRSGRWPRPPGGPGASGDGVAGHIIEGEYRRDD